METYETCDSKFYLFFILLQDSAAESENEIGKKIKNLY